MSSGSVCEEESACIETCVLRVTADGGVADNGTLTRCAAQCGGVVTEATNDLIGCLFAGAHPDGGEGMDCLAACFEP